MTKKNVKELCPVARCLGRGRKTASVARAKSNASYPRLLPIKERFRVFWTATDDGRLVRRCLLLVCEATGMTLAYFTTCAKEDENLPIVRDAINWLHLHYNLTVKIVRSDDEMD